MIFRDFSTAVLCKHKPFDGVKKHLDTIGAEYPAAVEHYIESLDVTLADDVWTSDGLINWDMSIRS